MVKAGLSERDMNSAYSTTTETMNSTLAGERLQLKTGSHNNSTMGQQHNHHGEGGENHQPSSIANAVNEPHQNGGGGGVLNKSGGDLSSEDIDVTGGHDDAPSLSLSPPHYPPPHQPPANLHLALQRIKTHVLQPLLKDKRSTWFRKPVDAKKLGIFPIYYHVVKRPMDLGTVQKNIISGHYKSRAECLRDINQVWENAKTFNQAGHFVYVAADGLEILMKEKLAKLECDEAKGVLTDDVKPPKSASKARPPKQPLTSLPRPSQQPLVLDDDADDTWEPRKRAVRKVPKALPGETAQPQQLKKKYVENLSEQMRQCDALFRELTTQKLSRECVTQFMHVSVGGEQRMDLARVQQRLQGNYYVHPLQFANDVRRIVTECYRVANLPSDQEPLTGGDASARLASELLFNFETRFAKIDFDPVDNPASYDGKSGPGSDDIMMRGLVEAQKKMVDIQENLIRLIDDDIKLRRLERAGGAPKQRQRKKPAAKAKLNAAQPGTPAKLKRGRPPGASSGSSAPPTPVAKKPRQTIDMDVRSLLRQELANVAQEHQDRIVSIMTANKEPLTTDAEGFTEIDLESCSAKTFNELAAFIKSVKKPAAAPPAPVPQPTNNSPVKKRSTGDGRLSDSSSDSSDDDSSGDGDSSSSSDSDSD